MGGPDTEPWAPGGSGQRLRAGPVSGAESWPEAAGEGALRDLGMELGFHPESRREATAGLKQQL